MAAKAAGRPVVLSLHTAGHDEPDTVKRSGRLRWWAFKSADRFLSVSPSLVQACLAAGFSRNRVGEVPNGIDTTRFAPASAAQRQTLRGALGLDRDRPLVVFVGFFSSDKQPDVLVDAWLRAHREHGLDATLVLVGATRSTYFEVDTQLADRLQAAAAAQGRGDRLICPGSTHVVEQYLRAADLFVLPSRREGLPVALLEAMACGLPCIASRLPGSTDTIIDDGRNGVLVPPGDVAALAGGMTTLLGDPSRATALGAAARQTVLQRFSSDHVAARWLEAYDLAARSRATR
jgi:glycosyltransferase involved in cell wall biosynthesis